MGLLQDRTYVVMGVANERSIAWGIARALDREGARLVFTIRSPRRRKNIEALLPGLTRQDALVIELDVERDEAIDGLAAFLQKEGITVHGLVHSVALARPEELAGEFIATGREGFRLAHEVSVYSLVAVSRALRPLMPDGGSIVTLTYLGSERVVPNYNVMGVAKAALEASVRYLAYDLGKDGIRVNAISAGPIRTVSARGVSGFSAILKVIEERAPLRRNITLDDVAGVAVFLLSDLSRAVTGEVIHVDAGYHVMGL
ncbi:enoyl-ACP reductase FabI [Hydrogenibacillus sp. N12]|uniref:enoyl-ACP reductase FabI n=1 Tax=Hydrogenibacillus sp. N12 TaxID=2866627 RepID=UPI001C7D8E8E|nr:enoyl-ACP reductase FabI [Hydrogenibacillus sp. N12]QZA33417.1 enoyl-ACP reductase FabI [Hydrogenibacillus sp. N12]